MPTSSPLKLFIIYAREDQTALLELKAHLRPLEKRGDLTVWYDGEILPGEHWHKVITHHLSEADIILLLVTDSLLDSEYINLTEVQTAFKRASTGQAVILPVILRDCMWEYTGFADIQVILKDGKPIGETEGGYLWVVRQIAEVVSRLKKPESSANAFKDIIDPKPIQPNEIVQAFADISDGIIQRLLIIESTLKGLQNEMERIKAEQEHRPVNMLSLSEIKDLVSKNQPSGALSQIKKWIEFHIPNKPEKMDNWILISAQFNDYSQNRLLGKLSESDLQLQNTRILSAIIALIRECENA